MAPTVLPGGTPPRLVATRTRPPAPLGLGTPSRPETQPPSGRNRGRYGMGRARDRPDRAAQARTGPRLGCRQTTGPIAAPGRTRSRTGPTGRPPWHRTMTGSTARSRFHRPDDGDRQSSPMSSRVLPAQILGSSLAGKLSRQLVDELVEPGLGVPTAWVVIPTLQTSGHRVNSPALYPPLLMVQSSART
jgi:hypothetical protein